MLQEAFAYLYSERGVVERLVILESILHDLFGQRLEEHAIVNSETRQQHACVDVQGLVSPDNRRERLSLLTKEKARCSKQNTLPETHESLQPTTL
jgi:hypothetical protein